MESPQQPVLKVKRLTETAQLPTRGSDKSAGLDLYASEDTYVHPGKRNIIKTGLAVVIEDGHYGRVAPRSGLALKSGIDVLGGVIDSDYRGELGVMLLNTDYKTFSVKRGDRIAQLIIEKIAIPKVVEIDDLDETNRGAGGFGSTGQ